MKIILVGYMGSGKSTIGKQLSKSVGITFYDLDEIIQKTEGRKRINHFTAAAEACSGAFLCRRKKTDNFAGRGFWSAVSARTGTGAIAIIALPGATVS